MTNDSKTDAAGNSRASLCSSDLSVLTLDERIDLGCKISGKTRAEFAESIDRTTQKFIDLAEEAHPAIRQIVKDAMYEVGLTKTFAELQSSPR